MSLNYTSDDLIFLIDGIDIKLDINIRIYNINIIYNYMRLSLGKFYTYIRSINGINTLINILMKYIQESKSSNKEEEFIYFIIVILYNILVLNESKNIISENILNALLLLTDKKELYWKNVREKYSTIASTNNNIDNYNDTTSTFRSNKRKKFNQDSGSNKNIKSIDLLNIENNIVYFISKYGMKIENMSVSLYALYSLNSITAVSSMAIKLLKSSYLTTFVDMLNENFIKLKLSPKEITSSFNDRNKLYVSFKYTEILLSIFENLSREVVSGRMDIAVLTVNNLLGLIVEIFNLGSNLILSDQNSTNIYFFVHITMRILVNFTNHRALSVDYDLLTTKILELFEYSSTIICSSNTFLDKLSELINLKPSTSSSSEFIKQIKFEDAQLLKNSSFVKLNNDFMNISTNNELKVDNHLYDCLTLCLGLLINCSEMNTDARLTIVLFKKIKHSNSMINFLLKFYSSNFIFAEIIESIGFAPIVDCFLDSDNNVTELKKTALLARTEDAVMECRILAAYSAILLSFCCKIRELDFCNVLIPYQLECIIKTIDDFTLFQYAASMLTSKSLRSLLECSKHFRKVVLSLSKSHPGSMFVDKSLITKSTLSLLPTEIISKFEMAEVSMLEKNKNKIPPQPSSPLPNIKIEKQMLDPFSSPACSSLKSGYIFGSSSPFKANKRSISAPHSSAINTPWSPSKGLKKSTSLPVRTETIEFAVSSYANKLFNIPENAREVDSKTLGFDDIAAPAPKVSQFSQRKALYGKRMQIQL